MSPLRHAPPPVSPRRPFVSRGLLQSITAASLLGLLIATLLVAVAKSQRSAQNTRFIRELSTVRDALRNYVAELGVWPPEAPEGFPLELESALPPARWNRPTPIGGHWHWLYQQDGIKAAFEVRGVEVNDRQLKEIDARIDNGDLSTGRFRRTEDGCLYVLEF